MVLGHNHLLNIYIQAHPHLIGPVNTYKHIYPFSNFILHERVSVKFQFALFHFLGLSLHLDNFLMFLHICPKKKSKIIISIWFWNSYEAFLFFAKLKLLIHNWNIKWHIVALQTIFCVVTTFAGRWSSV